MIRYLALVGAALLGACAHSPRPAPEPVIVTKEVKVPVTVPLPKCSAVLPPAPSYPDTPEAMTAASDIFERTKLLLKGRLLRIQRELELAAALGTCEPD
jgi:hypothetical protein